SPWGWRKGLPSRTPVDAWGTPDGPRIPAVLRVSTRPHRAGRMVPRGTFPACGLRHADRSAESARGRGARPLVAGPVALVRDVPRLREGSATAGGGKWSANAEEKQPAQPTRQS